MCLKLFPRYAGRARRGATVAGDHLRGTAVVVENAPKSLSRHDGASVIRACRQRCEELVAETLVVPFCVIVLGNTVLPWCTTPIEAQSSLGPDFHHPIISLSGIPSAVMVLRILHPILASTLCAANPLARIAEPTIAL